MSEAVIGRRLARPNARRAASGRGRHVADLAFKRLVDVAFVRSPYSHARIRSIDIAGAKAQPGVVAVLTGAELAERSRPWLGTMKNAPALLSVPQYGMAVDCARWQGEPAVAVVAEGRARAEDAAEHVLVEWEELPAVADVETALEDGAPILHPSLGTNRLYERTVETGDAAAAFAAARLVVEGEFRFGRHTGVPLEARAIVADYDPGDRKLTLHYGGQAPHMTQILFARHLGLKDRDVRVIAHDVGGGFGIKSHHYGDEFTAAALAILLARPVRYWADRLESFVSDIHARDHVIRGRLAVDEDGRIAALEIEDLVGAGAYSSYPRTSTVEANQVLNTSGGPYEIGNYRGRTTVVFQNKVPTSQYRGVGHPIAILTVEALIDRAASALGLDPAKLRQRNFVPDDAYPVKAPSGVGLDGLSHQACMEKLLELMDYDALCADREEKRKQGILRGIGLASFIKGTNPGPQIYGPAGVPISAQDGCTVRLEPSGAVTCLADVTEQGQGTETIIAQVVADSVGVPFEAVAVITGDTDAVPYGGGTYGSRGGGIGGESARRAGEALRDEILDVAGTLLQADPATLAVRDGAVVARGGGETRMTLAELGDIAFFRPGELPDGVYPSLTQTRRFRVPEYVFTNGAHGAQVEIDTDTGAVRILGYWAVEDGGRLINPLLAEEQLRGAIVQGLGDALYEHSLYDWDGQLLNGTMVDYLVPMAAEMPDIVLAHVETPTSASGLGAKGVGESGTAAAPGTVFNAVNDALAPLGAAVGAIPITPDSILAALGHA